MFWPPTKFSWNMQQISASNVFKYPQYNGRSSSSGQTHMLKADDPTRLDSEPVFVKGTWFPTRFRLFISDGRNAWSCNPSKEEVRERASQWDQPVSEYIDLAEQHLGFQQPGSLYAFSDAPAGEKRLSWTFEREGTKLEWRWKCQLADDCRKGTAQAHILDFLMDANIRFSEDVVRKPQLTESLKLGAEMCLAQSEKFSIEKAEFESAIYEKFLGVLELKEGKIKITSRSAQKIRDFWEIT